MQAPRARGRDVRTWIGRIAFGLSVLALLGTSLPRWQLDAKLEGPDRAPSEDGAIKLTIESSHPPAYRRMSAYGEQIEGSMCTAGWREKTPKIDCLLPPGSRLVSVDAADKCHDSGCCSNKPCKPPGGAFIRATTQIVPIWKKTAEHEARVEIVKSKQEGKKFVLRYLEVDLKDAPRDVEVTVRGKSAGDRGAAWDGKERNVHCTRFEADAGETAIGCKHYGLGEAVERPTGVTIVVKATIFGACDVDAGACSPPPEADRFRIADVAMKAD